MRVRATVRWVAASGARHGSWRVQLDRWAGNRRVATVEVEARGLVATNPAIDDGLARGFAFAAAHDAGWASPSIVRLERP